MSSPLSAPFSVFPSKSHTCLHPRCTYRGTRSLDLDRHIATHHHHHRSSMGQPHSPTTTALNVQPTTTTTTAAFPSPPLSDTHDTEATEYPFPSTQPMPSSHDTLSSSSSPSSSSSSSSSPQQSPSPRHYKFPFGYHAPAKSSTASTTSSAASSSLWSLRGKFRLGAGPAGGRKGVLATRRSADTVMRCGRHGDEWLGLTGWRFWR